MSVKNLTEAIEFAISQEINAANIYKKLMDLSTEESNKKLFKDLMDMEYDHKRRLETLDILDYQVEHSMESIQDLKLTDYLVIPDERVDLSYQDALILAAKRELKSFEMYEKFAQQFAENEVLKEFFYVMANEEKLHKIKIEKMYEDKVIQEN
ncbi:MAG: ferritin family protein [Candidatus Delongbacteria bacterium]|nr:ferritin family protein [Candidatus Delongbacteria bacterium]MBN2833647.1 ferritin family protein [Candidatus Delongbacteria bacterium]